MENINNAIKHKTISVWTEVPDGLNSVRDERENIFKNLEDAISFMHGKTVKNYVNRELQIKENERVALVEMNIVFDENKLLKL